MANKILLATIVADLLFLGSGVMELAFCLVVKNQMNDIPTNGEQATRNLLYKDFPLTAGIINASLTIAVFVITLPGLLMPMRGWLKTSGYMATVCGLFTLCVGVYLWVMTLRVKEDFFPIFVYQDPEVQALIQTEFVCCGYFNSTAPAFVTDTTCPSPAAAALLRGCATAISNFANVFIDNIFTAVFGVVGIDALLILAMACLSKDRKERERYRHIDEKSGYRQI